MAGRGPAPKPRPTRSTDEKARLAEMTLLVRDDVVRGPDLPPVMEWPAQTVATYEALRRDPVAQTLTDADWNYLLDTMLLSADLWSGNPKVAPELRLRLAGFGVTPEARMRLRLLIDNAPEEQEEPALDRIRRLAEEKKAKTARKRRILRQIENP